MPVKYLEIREDPFTNDSSEFILILTIAVYNVPNPTAPGTGSYSSGILKDPTGNIVGYSWVAWYQDYEVTGSLSDEAFAHSWSFDLRPMLIPPGYSFGTFGYATALQGTLEELAPFIRGM